MTSRALEQLEKAIGHSFRDRSLLEKALTHSSHAREKGVDDNERLEFLGDAVLDLVVSDLLMDRRPDCSEGDLSRTRAGLVNARVLSSVGQELGLAERLKLGKGEERGGGRNKQRLLASAYEAVIGAVFKDAGFQVASRCIASHFGNLIDEADPDELDHKTRLQELTQARLKMMPEYRVVDVSGPDHRRTYRVEVDVDGRAVAGGSGPSRKLAEKAAAKAALDTLGKQNDED